MGLFINETPETINGYRIEDLARVAALIEEFGVRPEEIKRLSDNWISLFAVVMNMINED